MTKMDEDNIAVFLDFENLAVSAERVYPSKEKPLKISPVLDHINTLGNVLIKKAYANWSRPIFHQYQQDLSNHGFELIHLPETTLQGKNGSDVKLAIDLMEHMEVYGTASTYIIGSGDSDFIPLIQSIRKRGKRVLVIGFNSSVGHVVKKVCNEYKSMEGFLGRPEEDLSMDDDPEIALKEARDLLQRYSKNLEEEEMGVLLSKLKVDLKRIDPSFSESKCGFRSFKDFISHFEGDILKIIEDPENKGSFIAYFNERTGDFKEEFDRTEEASKVLNKWGYIKDPKKRSYVAGELIDVMNKKDHPSINEMTDAIYDGRKRISKKRIQRFLMSLYHQNVFRQVNESYQGPLYTRWFEFRRRNIDEESVLSFYYETVTKLLKDKFPEISDQNLEKLLRS